MLLLRGGCQLIDNESLVIEFLSFRHARQSVWCETVRGGARRERLGLLRADLGRAPCANPQGRRGARETESPRRTSLLPQPAPTATSVLIRWQADCGAQGAQRPSTAIGAAVARPPPGNQRWPDCLGQRRPAPRSSAPAASAVTRTSRRRRNYPPSPKNQLAPGTVDEERAICRVSQAREVTADHRPRLARPGQQQPAPVPVKIIIHQNGRWFHVRGQ